MKKIYTVMILLFAVSILCYAQSQPPKREFRAAWVATVSNIDWPSSSSLSTSVQKSEIISILDKHKANNINAILFQVRPSCDAFYLNALEPLSQWLVGSQGGNFSGTAYDPLQFWIDEAHKRGMELHCWFNPYRSVVSSTSSVHSTHISKTQPTWNINYGTIPHKFLDPGIPAVQNYSLSVIMDVVRRYNIDGVHFDDYFYPYGGMTNQDSATFVNYKGAFTNIGEWRRNNVNKFIAMVHDNIKAVKPWVKFGVSPFGIWKPGFPAGVTGLDAYNVIYCDAVDWLQNRKVDYITPQLYWRINNGVTGPNGSAQDYNVLMPWWSNIAKTNKRHFYPGHAAHNLALNISAPYPKSDWPAQEIQNQVNSNRLNDRTQGSVFFSSKSVTNNLKGIQDSLRANQFKYIALQPTMPWLDSIAPLAPTNLIAAYNGIGITLQWQKPGTASDNDSARYYAVYRAQSPDTINGENIKQIVAITTNDSTRYVDNSVVNGSLYSYLVTAFDKLNNESATTARINLTATGVDDVYSAPIAYVLDQNFPNPFNPVTTIQFTLRHNNFTSLKIYDLLGREIATVVEGELGAGTYSYQFSGENLASGVYVYRIVSGSFVQAKKMVLQK